MSVSVAGATRISWNEAAFRQLTQSPLGPVGRDLQRRALAVTTRMKQNVRGRPGPQVDTGNLLASIGFLFFGADGQGLRADIGAQPGRTMRRGWNYPILLEFGHGSTPAYPWCARSLEAAAG